MITKTKLSACVENQTPSSKLSPVVWQIPTAIQLQAPRISRQSAHEGGKVVSPRRWQPLPPRRCPWYSFPLEAD
jgi:hypothetical protein